jgi:hypothetical protein
VALQEKHRVWKISKSPSKEDNFMECDLSKKEAIEKLDFGNTIFDMIVFNA